MRRQNRDIHLYQSRSRNGRGDYVVCRGGNAHTQNQGRDHGEEHGRQQLAACQIQQRGSQLQTDAGLGYDADDDAGGSAGDQYAQHTFGTVDQTIDKIRGGNACALTQAGADDGQRDGVQSRPHGSITGNQQVHDDDQGNGQMAFFPQQLAKLRQLFPGGTL